jgi:hypothetical protein
MAQQPPRAALFSEPAGEIPAYRHLAGGGRHHSLSIHAPGLVFQLPPPLPGISAGDRRHSPPLYQRRRSGEEVILPLCKVLGRGPKEYPLTSPGIFVMPGRLQEPYPALRTLSPWQKDGFNPYSRVCWHLPGPAPKKILPGILRSLEKSDRGRCRVRLQPIFPLNMLNSLVYDEKKSGYDVPYNNTSWNSSLAGVHHAG